MSQFVDQHINKHIIQRIQKIQTDTALEDIEAGLEFITQQYRTNEDKQVRVSIRAKMSELLDYIFDNNLNDKIELTNYMLYD